MTNFISRKVFFFRDQLPENVSVLAEFPLFISAKSQKEDLIEARARLQTVLQNELQANAALGLHYVENSSGGAYVAKVALIGKQNKHQRGPEENEIGKAISRVNDNFEEIIIAQFKEKSFPSFLFVTYSVSLFFLMTEHNFLSDSEFLFVSFSSIAFYPLFFLFMYKRSGGKPFNLRSFYFPKEKVFVEVEKRTQKF